MSEIAELLRDGIIGDPFFEVLHDGEWNACIGKQGEEINYVEGYLEAAKLLVDTLIEKELYGQRDTLAMPILFNSRHGLELALKYVLRELISIGMAQPREGPIDHDIQAYWEHLDAQRIGDRGCRSELVQLKPFVESFARKDIDGQELRYFATIEGKHSLAEQSVVNLHLIRAAVGELREILHRLMDRVYRLEQESATGTRTRECSRSDLAEIAKMVGAKSTWAEDSFLQRKAEAMERFELSSNSFSRALNAVKESRELKTLVEVETPLTYLSADKATEIVARWLEAHPPASQDAEPRVIDVASIGFEEVMRYSDAMRVLNEAALDQLSVEEFADLQTIFYIGRDRRFGEEYDASLERTLVAHRRQSQRFSVVHNILSKTNFIEGLAAGLSRVGQSQLAARIKGMQDQARQQA